MTFADATQAVLCDPPAKAAIFLTGADASLIHFTLITLKYPPLVLSLVPALYPFSLRVELLTTVTS